jgi:hypothetical protein
VYKSMASQSLNVDKPLKRKIGYEDEEEEDNLVYGSKRIRLETDND